MPAISSVVLTDRASTPVDHTMVPTKRDAATGVWTFRESGASTSIAAKQLTVSAREQSGKFRARFVLKVPTVQTETINGVDSPKVIRTGFGEISFTFDPASSLQERKDIVAMLQSALDAGDLLDDALTEMASIY
jgi:hypothetical protein